MSTELDRAVAKGDPQQILEAVASVVGLRLECAADIELAHTQEEQAAVAHRLRNVVERDARQGYLNADEEYTLTQALDGLL